MVYHKGVMVWTKQLPFPYNELLWFIGKLKNLDFDSERFPYNELLWFIKFCFGFSGTFYQVSVQRIVMVYQKLSKKLLPKCPCFRTTNCYGLWTLIYEKIADTIVSVQRIVMVYLAVHF